MKSQFNLGPSYLRLIRGQNNLEILHLKDSNPSPSDFMASWHLFTKSLVVMIKFFHPESSIWSFM